jgi:putative Holliday junction resolvase
MASNTTVLGFDFGTKYIGVAVGQTITHLATPITSIPALDGVPDWAVVKQLVDSWKPDLLLVGIPLNMDGTEQPMTTYARHFSVILKQKTGLKIVEIDERLSTWEAKQRVLAQKKHKNPRSQAALNDINATSAAILVEQWLLES